MTEEVLAARVLVASPDRVHEGGGVLIEGGLVRRVLANRGEVARAARAAGRPATDLGERVLTAGLVNAHAHLELGALAQLGRGVRGDRTFATWIGEVVAARGALTDARSGDEAGPDALERAAMEGARRLAAGGTTAVGDVDSSGAAERAHARAPLRVRLYREVLDLELPARRTAALERLDAPFPRVAHVLPGVSPHAPYTVGPRLLDEVAARMRRHAPWACSVHWAETDEETEWLAHGTGPLSGLLGAPGTRATNDLARLVELGLCGPRSSLVHANEAGAEDLDRIAASGAAIVHCPGTHAFFDRAPFPFEEVLARGIPLAVGTDSLASNAGLDMLRELSLLRRSAPGLDPRSVWRAATEGGARAIGCAGRAGVLEPGAWADLAVFETRERGGDALEALTSGAACAVATWVAGRAVGAEPAARGPDGA